MSCWAESTKKTNQRNKGKQRDTKEKGERSESLWLTSYMMHPQSKMGAEKTYEVFNHSLDIS